MSEDFDEHEPLSPARASAHVLVSIILLIGTIVVEWGKKKFELSFLSRMILVLPELVVLMYLIGSLGRACRFAIHEWTKELFSFHRTTIDTSFKQLIPHRADIITAIKAIRYALYIAIGLIVFLCALLILVFGIPAPACCPDPEYNNRWSVYITRMIFVYIRTFYSWKFGWFLIVVLSIFVVLFAQAIRRQRLLQIPE